MNEPLTIQPIAKLKSGEVVIVTEKITYYRELDNAAIGFQQPMRRPDYQIIRNDGTKVLLPESCFEFAP